MDNRVLKYFYDNPGQKIHLRELARQTGLSPTGASKMLKQLVREDLVVEEKTKLAAFYRPNYSNQQFYTYKKTHNLLKLKTSELLSDLIEFYQRPDAIVVFGSYANGTDTEDSDIDILVITKKTGKFNATKYEKHFKRGINVMVMPSLKKASKEFINNVANGEVLFGYLKVRE